jgi:transposase-like protein
MEWDGIEIVKKLMKQKGIVLRERTPIETMLYALFLYLGGLSLKGVKTRLLRVNRSRTAIWKWIQKFSILIGDKIADDLPEIIIVDETCLRVKDMNLWFWYAIDPETRKIVYYKITWNRHNQTCKKFFQELEKQYEKKPKLVITDGGPWYKILPRIGFNHEVVSGGIRSYVERVIETVKDRTRLFDNYFPSRYVWVAGHVHRWMKLYLFYYNWIRSHMTFNDNSPILTDKGIIIHTEYERFLYVLKEVVLC